MDERPLLGHGQSSAREDWHGQKAIELDTAKSFLSRIWCLRQLPAETTLMHLRGCHDCLSSFSRSVCCLNYDFLRQLLQICCHLACLHPCHHGHCPPQSCRISRRAAWATRHRRRRSRATDFRRSRSPLPAALFPLRRRRRVSAWRGAPVPRKSTRKRGGRRLRAPQAFAPRRRSRACPALLRQPDTGVSRLIGR